MIQGAKKISQLTTTTLNGSEVIPVVQDDGLGNLTTYKVALTSLTDTNMANTNLTLTGNRTHDLNSYSLRFDNGKVIIGDNLSLPYLLSVSGATESSNGIFTVTNNYCAINATDDNGIGVQASSKLGKALQATCTSTGNAAVFQGNTYVETNGIGGGQDTSSVFEVRSISQGALLPRMTTTQRNTIGIPATGLEIYNTTTNRKEVYNGTFWQGISMRFLQVFFTQWNPTDAQTVAFGSVAGTPQLASTSPAHYEIVMRGNGVIRGCDFNTFAAGVDGSNEAWQLFVRHNGTDYLVQSVSSTSKTRVFSNTSLNIPYVAGDIVRMVFINPTWATNPTQVVGGGFLTLQ